MPAGVPTGVPGAEEDVGEVPSCPTLYMYGADKPSRFHGDDWLVAVEGNGAGSGVVRVDGAGHWFPVTHADEVNARLTEWLDAVVELPPTRNRAARSDRRVTGE